jgi:hypothetical protein
MGARVIRIRGIFLQDYIKIVQSTPELEWDRFLTEADWEVVRGTILPTAWYPADTMAHIGRGIFEMRSKGNYAVVRLHGRARATDAYDEATRKFLIKGDPNFSLLAFVSIVGRVIEGVTVKLEQSGHKEAWVSFFPVDNVPAWDLFREIQAGTLEALVELNGGKNARSEFLSETRDGREACLVQVAWE